jgi:hypothetical protein
VKKLWRRRDLRKRFVPTRQRNGLGMGLVMSI